MARIALDESMVWRYRTMIPFFRERDNRRLVTAAEMGYAGPQVLNLVRSRREDVTEAGQHP
jgi:hypothetical protein